VVKVKERLTGAIILVALIVLLVPELLTGPIRLAPRAALAASSAEEPPLRSYTINLADDARARSGTSSASGPEQPAPLPVAQADAPPSPSPAPITQAPANPPARPSNTPSQSAAAAPARPASAPAKSTAPPSAPLTPAVEGGAFVIQLGSFASRANAERLAQRVRAQGFQVAVSQGSSGRHLYRVRVGPAHDRAAATQLAQKLQAAGHSGPIVPK
jgi:cell division septation protein DedD